MNDGDTEIRALHDEKVQPYNMLLGFDNEEDLKEELIDYGHEAPAADAAIKEASTCTDWIKV
jgi:hypothetical protein